MSLTVSRTPLRITLGGGGSDLAADGLCVAAAINLYTYVVVNRNKGSEYILKYSDKVERVTELEDIEHPLIHSCLAAMNVEPGVEIAWLSDIDGGMGLGSSASFIVGTLVALGCEREEAAKIAIEIDTGWQDQFICAGGGVRTMFKNLSVKFSIDTKFWEDRLYLVSTGMKHDTQKVLANLNPIPQSILVDQANRAAEYIVNNDIQKLAGLFNEQWSMKREYNDTPEHEVIAQLMQEINGFGMKLIGAGNGGYVLVCDVPNAPIENAIKFKFDNEGSILLQEGMF